jgi:AraC-like DNA-binding protein
MDFITFLILFGISIGVFLGILLITLGRGNKSANRLLGLLLLSFSLSITGFVIERTDTQHLYHYLQGLTQSVLFLFGPLFFFYVKVLTKRKFVFREDYLFHFLPFLFLIIYQIPFLVKDPAEKLPIIQSGTFRIEWMAILSVQIVHLFIYLFFAYKLIRKHEKRIKTTMSSIERINLNWLRAGVLLFVAVFSMIMTFVVLFLTGIDLLKYFQVIIPISVSLIILMMGFYGLKQPIIFSQENKVKPKKYEKSNLTNSLSEEYLEKLLCYMDTEKPYLQSNLTLQKLALAIGITPHHLSQIINEKLKQNFFDFVNQYRVKEAQKMLVHPQGQLLTILAISEEVGFNSKTAFNTAFKKVTKMTPSDFRKNNS